MPSRDGEADHYLRQVWPEVLAVPGAVAEAVACSFPLSVKGSSVVLAGSVAGLVLAGLVLVIRVHA